jgi:GTP-binding protein
VRVELHLIADIGLLGQPNAGKSTLLSVLTNARPLIGDFPFTTKVPNLGLLRSAEGDIVIADVPGIIEGASRGRGLGLRFLRHIERCSALLYLADLGEQNCAAAIEVLSRELDTYQKDLVGRPRLLVGTKLDREGGRAALRTLVDSYPGERVLGISSITGEGIPELERAIRGICGL